MVSIHAPVKGATSEAFSRKVAHGVSIHAPVKGATYVHCKSYQAPTSFNPRARKGRDPVIR